MRLVPNPCETRSCHAGQRNAALLSLGPNGEGCTFAPTSGFAGLSGEEWFLGKEVKNNAYAQGKETLSPQVRRQALQALY